MSALEAPVRIVAILLALAAPSGVPVESPNAPPRIVDVVTSAAQVSTGDTLAVYVIASSNVASVTANFANQTVPFERRRPGVFHFTYKVPWVPFFLKRTYSMKVVAINARGAATSRDIPITLR